MYTSTEIENILKAIDVAKTIVITAHQFPDGDAVGSSLALYHFLKKKGKDAKVLLPKNQIGRASILAGFDEIENTETYEFTTRPDLIICLDCAEPSRICHQTLQDWIRTPGKTINIDHHGKQLFGDLNYVIPDYSSTGELIFNIAIAAKWEITQPEAEAIWLAIISDTRRFSLPSTRASTFHCAATLIEKGARAAWLCDITAQEPLNVVELRKRALNSLELWENGKIAVISLSVADFLDTHACKQDTEEFPEIPRSIKGHQIAAFVYPLLSSSSKSEIRISIRSKPGSPVSARTIATHFGGAGHEDSAGAVFIGTVHDAKNALKNYLIPIYKKN